MCHNLDFNKKDILRNNIINIITNYYYKINNEKNFNPIVDDYVKTSNFLKNSPNLIVSRSDKRNYTVILYKNEYLESMIKMLDDNKIYKIIINDPTNKFQIKANLLIDTL